MTRAKSAGELTTISEPSARMRCVSAAISRCSELITDYIWSDITNPSSSMRSSRIKPISYLKANAAEILDRLAEEREQVGALCNHSRTSGMGIAS